MTADRGPWAQYQNLISTGELEQDFGQELAVEKLQILHDELAGYTLEKPLIGWKKFLPFNNKTPSEVHKGLYIFGGVGRGKSMLMDLFFDGADVRRKRRVHFHKFMQEAHETIHQWRQGNKNTKEGEPINPTAQELAKKNALLCFDEFEIRDIADAMIVARLFTAMLELGVVVVATSNRHPNELYKDGLQRDRFLPFIKLVQERMNILQLTDGVDYRLDRIKEMGAYLTPAGRVTDIALNKIFSELTDEHPSAAENVEFKGRKISIPRACDRVAMFTFDDLCKQPLGAGDFLAIAERYKSIIISDIPILRDENRDSARRFIVMIDAFYDNCVHVIVSAAVDPSELYYGRDWKFEFERTISRLMEMQSVEYIEAARGRL